MLSRLTALRIILTLAAIAGLLPVTLVFIWGATFILVGSIAISPENWIPLAVVLGAISISLFCIWTGWKIYVISMSAAPQIANKTTLISGVLVTAIWGVLWACIGQPIQNTAYIFLMPGVTAAAMLAITLKRETLNQPPVVELHSHE